MILIIAILAILLLIACICLHLLNQGVNEAHKVAKEYKARWLSEIDVSSALRNEKHHEWERANIAEEQVISLKTDLADLQATKVPDSEVQDKAIRNRYPRKPTPMDYYQLFEAHPIGRDVMDDLVNIFGGATYVRGGHDADRETCFKAGKKFVVDHILIQVSKATETKQDKSEVTIDDN